VYSDIKLDLESALCGDVIWTSYPSSYCQSTTTTPISSSMPFRSVRMFILLRWHTDNIY